MAKNKLFGAENFLRSININFDADFPERIYHFKPTSKSLHLIENILLNANDRSFFVVAPYGSGKSLTITYLLQILENRNNSKDVLQYINKQVKELNPQLGNVLTKRKNDNTKALVIALNGSYSELHVALFENLIASINRIGLPELKEEIELEPKNSVNDFISVVRKIYKFFPKYNLSNISIFWDEYGRHLEQIVADGKSSELEDIQNLAEFANRSKLKMSLAFLLHQGLMNYAHNVTNSVRKEWKKVEGRFNTIQYVDDSKEIYRLIGEVLDNKKHMKNEHPVLDAKIIKELNLFLSFSEDELTDLLYKSRAIHPFVLFLLPRISARVAQNERTLFSFLYSFSKDSIIGIDELFDYFSSSMQADNGLGGTYKQWLETNSAILKVDNELSVNILKSACLLGLGTRGERNHVTKTVLELSIANTTRNKIISSIDSLLDKKLLLHRKLNDEITVWHGADLDLRGKLDDEKSKQRLHFNLIEFLNLEVSAPHWKPVKYNDDFKIRRYLSGQFISFDTLRDDYLKLDELPIGTDGIVLYIIPKSEDELLDIRENLSNNFSLDRAICIVPNKFISFDESALEVVSLNSMKSDPMIIGDDPLVLPELLQMVDDSRSYLQKIVDRITIPGNENTVYYHKKIVKVSDSREFRFYISDIMAETFNLTPRLSNEMIVKKNPTGVISNARKKLIFGILDRTGTENLGLEGNRPDVSVFRTLILNTGLYRIKNDVWSWAQPEELNDKGLQDIWKMFKEFLTVAGIGKSFEALFNELQKQPYGLRAGVIPIFLAASLKAYPSAIAITKNKKYLIDILPTDIEEICRNPEIFKLDVITLNSDKKKYLQELLKVFTKDSQKKINESDLIRKCYDAIEFWKSKLPIASLTTKRVQGHTKVLQKLLNTMNNPINTLLVSMPNLLGIEIKECDKIISEITSCKMELENINMVYFNIASRSFLSAIQVYENEETLQHNAKSWADCFTKELTVGFKGTMIQPVLNAINTGYKTDYMFLRAISSLIISKTFERWDDSTITIFDNEIHAIVNKLEETTLSINTKTFSDKTKEGIISLTDSKIENLYQKLIALIGKDEALKTIKDKIKAMEN